MKCQKCGASLSEGYLYCSQCGNEYQIVPNFEPEIENSIAETMSDVGDSIITEGKQLVLNEKHVQLPEKEGRKKWFYVVFPCSLLFILLITAGIFFYRDSLFYLKKASLKAVEEGSYPVAIEYFDRLRKKEPGNSHWYLEEARLELLCGNPDTAIQLSYRALNETINNREIYTFLLNLLISDHSYQEVYQLLKDCKYEDILEDYKEYNSTVGKLSHEGGRYFEIIKLKLEGSSKVVYYTTDGTTPDNTSTYYSEPIVLGNGTHTVSFLPYNEYGVAGEIIRKEFTIHTTTPVAPVVWPENGILEQPERIQIEVEPGSRVYYTLDGSTPDENSHLYEEPIPIPLGESEFCFMAISDSQEKSEITRRKYHLAPSFAISISQAEEILMEELILNGHILDKNGAIQDRYGVFRYFYQYPLRIEGRNFYVFEEHYLENLIDNPLKNYYGVDMENKAVFSLKKDFLGRYYLDI